MINSTHRSRPFILIIAFEQNLYIFHNEKMFQQKNSWCQNVSPMYMYEDFSINIPEYCDDMRQNVSM